jgi:homogentisate phytyltransferase/homogentisate geranylgeranyltransferase
MFVLGFVLVIGVKGPPILNEETIFYLPFIFISILFAGLFSIITNNIADIDIDEVCNKERPLVRSEISLMDYKKIAWLSLSMALVYAAAVNFKVFFLILFCIGNYFIYSMPPLRIKRIPFFSKAVILLNSVALVIIGFNGLNNLNILYFLKFIHDFGASINNFSLLFGLFLFGCILAINFIDIKDYEGDKKGGVKTLPVIFGLRISKIVIGCGFLAAYFLAGILIGSKHILWLSTLLGLVQFYLVNKKIYQEGYVFAVYLVSLVGLFLVIFGILK